MGKPVFGTENQLTYRELHAAVIGSVVGFLAGYAHLVGRTSLAAGVSTLFVVLALGVGATGHLSTARRTVRKEPWYALAAFLGGGAAAVALLGGTVTVG